jgi:putative ABC transport system permease protein
MNPWIGVLEGLREINSHKFRSVLTVLGLVLGIACLIGVLSITEGMAHGLRQILQDWGGLDRLSINDQPPPEEQEGMEDVSPGLTETDVRALERLSLICAISPELRLDDNVFIRHGTRRFDTRYLRGVTADFLTVDRHQIAAGRFFTDLDQLRGNRVIVIGQQVCRDLFGKIPVEEALGKSVLVRNVRFQVVGIFSSHTSQENVKGRSVGGASWKERVVVIPLHTMQEVFFSSVMVKGVDQGPDRRLSRINVQIADPGMIDEAIAQIRAVLTVTHRGIEDFGVRTAEEWADAIENAVWGMRLSGGFIALVTLVAAGVGATNILLASIRERTREIGVRRAVGAAPGDIFLQIILESMVLAVLGGLAGLGAGMALVELLKNVLQGDLPPRLDSLSLVIGLVTALGVGLVSGLLPALRASNLQPIEALRFE